MQITKEQTQPINSENLSVIEIEQICRRIIARYDDKLLKVMMNEAWNEYKRRELKKDLFKNG